MEQSKKQKIDLIIKLMRGEIMPADLKPKKLLIRIGYSTQNEYFVNNREVSKEQFNQAAPKINKVNISYGEHQTANCNGN